MTSPITEIGYTLKVKNASDGVVTVDQIAASIRTMWMVPDRTEPNDVLHSWTLNPGLEEKAIGSGGILSPRTRPSPRKSGGPRLAIWPLRQTASSAL